MVATSLTIGIGGSGGVFAPSLFVGGMAGTVFGVAANALFPALHIAPGAFGLVGMAAVFAGAAHAPITAVLIVFELTGDYAIILPLLAGVVLATGVSHLVSRDNIYTLKLLRRGIDIDAESPADRALRRVAVRDLMRPAPDGRPATDAPSGPLRARLAPDPGAPVAGDPLGDAPELSPDASVLEVVDELTRHRGTDLLVRDGPDGPVLGLLGERDVLEHLRRAPS